MPPAACLVFSGLGALGISIFYYRRIEFPAILSILSPIALIFPAIFLFNENIQRVLSPPNVSSSLEGNLGISWVESRPPIFFIVLDELPLTNILNGDGEIDARYFPNLTT